MTLTTRTRSSAKAPALDAQGAAAVDLARTAALELAAPDGVGDHLGAEADDERVVTHFFACLSPAYVGWRWAVTVARASRSRIVTVDEAVLLPGAEAILAPQWLPWSERLRPGDLGVGDVLPTDAHDPRLEPGYVGALPWSLIEDEGGLDGDAPFPDEDAAVAWELGLGRHRVLSPIGRDDAIDRWYSGDRGPTAPIAEAAPADCGSCGFLLRMGGSLRRVFGVCANEYAPDDGRVVSLDHGCGAHSEAAVLAPPAGPSALIVDELGYEELHARSGSSPVSGDAASADAEPDPLAAPEDGVEVGPAGSEAEPPADLVDTGDDLVSETLEPGTDGEGAPRPATVDELPLPVDVLEPVAAVAHNAAAHPEDLLGADDPDGSSGAVEATDTLQPYDEVEPADLLLTSGPDDGIGTADPVVDPDRDGADDADL